MPKKPLTIAFDAYLPPIRSAIMMDGQGDEMQIKINASIKQSPEVLRMASMTNRRLHIVVTEIIETQAENYQKLPKNENNKTKSKDGAPVVDSGRFVHRGDSETGGGV